MGSNSLQRFPRFLAAAFAILALGLPAAGTWAAAAEHPLPLWQVSDGNGHRLYLLGSMHALTPGDYPLPAAFNEAFEHSQKLVEELDLGKITPDMLRSAIQNYAMLPAGKTLAGVLGDRWEQVRGLAAKAAIDLAPYQNFQPWFAAMRIVAQRFVAAGFRPDLGLDQHFTKLATARGMPIIGLETVAEQLGFFADLAPTLQQQFLIQTLTETPLDQGDLAALHQAWRNGDSRALAAIADRDFADFPELRKQLLTERNRRWLPILERCLSENQGCLVIVGAEHMVGPDGLVALFEEAGYRVEQRQGTVAPATADADTDG